MFLAISKAFNEKVFLTSLTHYNFPRRRSFAIATIWLVLSVARNVSCNLNSKEWKSFPDVTYSLQLALKAELCQVCHSPNIRSCKKVTCNFKSNGNEEFYFSVSWWWFHLNEQLLPLNKKVRYTYIFSWLRDCNYWFISIRIVRCQSICK